MSKDAHRKLYVESMLAEDDLGVVLRGMVYIESAMREYIEACLDDKQHVEGFFETAGFQRRMEWARALGLKMDAKMVDAVGKLASLRNELAHELGASLNEGQVNDLYGRLNDGEKSLVTGSMRDRRSDPRKMKPAWKARLRFSVTALVASVNARVQGTIEQRTRKIRRKK